jgi:hypothetical protein
MWYGIVGRRGGDGNFTILLSKTIHAFSGSSDESVKQVSLCGGVIRERREGAVWLDMWGRRGVVPVFIGLARDSVCKRCQKRMKQALVADRFLEKIK